MDVIVVVEGPSAAGKTTWCCDHATRWLPEPGPWPLDRVLRYQRARWKAAVAADATGGVIVLDGDPLKLYYSWARLRLGEITEAAWQAEVKRTRTRFAEGERGLADVVLYADPGVDELVRRKTADRTRVRRNFERHTAMRPYLRGWYQAVAGIDPTRVIWEHPPSGISDSVIGLGPRPDRSAPELFDELLDRLL